MEKIYIATEIIKAEPMTDFLFLKKIKKETPDRLQKLLLQGDGFKVTYSDNMVTWFPKDFFESFFRPLNINEEKMIVGSLINNHEREAI